MGKKKRKKAKKAADRAYNAFGTLLVMEPDAPDWSIADAARVLEERYGPLPKIEGTIDFAAGTIEMHYASLEDEARALMMEMDQEAREAALGLSVDD